MELLLKRKYLKQYYTIGHLYINGEYYCDTLEDTVRPDGIKVKGSTAIPAGVYKVDWTVSPRFAKFMPLLLDVPNFKGVRIHAGNTQKDTEGCILVGRNTKPGELINSRKMCDRLYKMIKSAYIYNEKITIKIVYA